MNPRHLSEKKPPLEEVLKLFNRETMRVPVGYHATFLRAQPNVILLAQMAAGVSPVMNWAGASV